MWKTVSDCISLGSKINEDGDCSHKIKRHLLLGRIAMTNLDSIVKSRDISLPTKIHIFKAMVFPVVMYRCEDWTIRKAEHQRMDAFEPWCWRRLLRAPWTVRKSKHLSPKGDQPWMFIGRTDADVKSWLFGKDPDAGKDWEQEKGVTEDEVVGWHHQLHGHEFEQTLGDSEGQESLACYSSWGHRVGQT